MAHLRRRGFTLVELLVVVGIIAGLLAVLLPALSRVRLHANRVECAATLRQLALAMIAYSHDNRGRYPGRAESGNEDPSDWVHWQAGRELSDSTLARHLDGFGPRLLRCPSDDPDVRPGMMSPKWTEPYGYSYSCVPQFSMVLRHRGYTRMRVNNASDLIMMIDEEGTTANDGAMNFVLAGNATGALLVESLLSSRHDSGRRLDPRTIPQATRLDKAGRPDRHERGNAAFADGHVGFVPRSLVWDESQATTWQVQN